MLQLTRVFLKTFSACSKLISRWISSLTPLATNVPRIRESLKAARTREEALDDMRRRKGSLRSKIVSEKKKYDKMGGDTESLQQQRPRKLLLQSLRRDLHAIDIEITNEEASLGDWKRIKAREWMAVLLGGLLECSEKGTVVAALGRAIIEDVPTETTQSGLPRARKSQPSNETSAGGIPRHPPPHSNPLAQPTANGDSGLNPDAVIGRFNMSSGGPGVEVGPSSGAVPPLMLPPNMEVPPDEHTKALQPCAQHKPVTSPPIQTQVENRDEVDSKRLTRLLIRKEKEVKQSHKLLHAAFERLESETRRVNEAEERVLEIARRFNAVNDARIQAQAEAAKLNLELGMYKLQLNNAQQEISKARNILRKV